MTSFADKVRFGFAVAFCFLAPFLVYRDAVHVWIAAGIVFTIAMSLSLLIAGRSQPRNWKRLSIWFLCLSIIVPSIVFILLFQFREGF
jgi:hypothetical protein